MGNNQAAGEGFPIAMPLPVQGSGRAWDAQFDPTLNYPRQIFNVTEAISYPVARGAFIEVSGDPVGYTFQPEGAQGPTIPLLRTAAFAAPKDGQLVIASVGEGTCTIIVWSAQVGAPLAQARGYAPVGSESSLAKASGNVLAYNAATTVTQKVGATSIGGNRNRRVISWFGATSGAITLTPQVSYDGATYYDQTDKAMVIAGAADFSLDYLTGAPYVALRTSAIIANLKAYLAWR